MAGANLVQDFDERHILLAVDVLQLYGHIVYLLQGLGTEEVGRLVVGLQHLFVFGCHNGCQLGQVAHHEQLDTTKGLVAVAVTAQHGIDGVEQVGPDHGNLVDDEQVDGGNDFALLAAEVVLALDLGAGDVG